MNHPHHLPHLAHHHISGGHPSGRVTGSRPAAAGVESLTGPTAAFQHSLNHHHRMMTMSQEQTSSFFPSRFKNLILGLENLQEMNHHPRINLLPFHPHSMSPLSIPSLSPSLPSASSSPGHQHGTSGHGFRGMKSKICGVCGDRAKSYHFGGISCDSCKAFFRRSVQNDAYKNFHCPYEAQCDINISSRKCCQFCRFKKCLSIGMEKSWVMTEEERLQMLKARLEKRQKQECMSTSDMASPTSPSPSDDQIGKSTLGQQLSRNPPNQIGGKLTTNQQSATPNHNSSQFLSVSPPTKEGNLSSSSSSSTLSASSSPSSSLSTPSFFQRSSSFGSNNSSAASNPPSSCQLHYEPDITKLSVYLSESQVKTIQNLVNHYVISCQEIPLHFPCEDEVLEEEGQKDGRFERNVGDNDDDDGTHHPTEIMVGGVANDHTGEVVVIEKTPSGNEEERNEAGRQERKRRKEDDGEQEDNEKMGLKKKSTSSSSSSPVSSSALQESRHSVSSSSESINIISVDEDEKEVEQIEEGKIMKVGNEESEERKRVKIEKGKSLMNDPDDVKTSRCTMGTNGRHEHNFRPYNHCHIINQMDEDEIDLLNSSNSNSSSSTSSWKTNNSSCKNWSEVPNRIPRQSKAKILEILFTSIQQLASFCKRIDSFSQLAPIDQEILLKGSILEMCFIKSGACFDPETNSWPDPNEAINLLLAFGSKQPGDNFISPKHYSSKSGQQNNSSLNSSGVVTQGQDGNLGKKVKEEMISREERKPNSEHVVKERDKINGSLSIFDVRPLMSHELFLKYTKFIRSIQEMNLDQISVIILCLILLMTPDRIGLSPGSIQFITRHQEKYLLLLQRYMIWKFGQISSSILFPKLLLKLPDLRELSELLTDYQLILCKEEVQSVQNKLQQQLIISSPRNDNRFQEE